MQSLSLAFNVVSPIILLLAIGKGLFHFKLIDSSFVSAANKLAYRFFLPCLLFSSVSQADMAALFDGSVFLTGLISTCIAFLLFLMAVTACKFPIMQRGVIVQASFRANMGIIGLALCANLLGDSGLALASVFLGIMVPIFNVLSVWVLVKFSGADKSPKDILFKVIKSPLIIAISIALPFSIFSVPPPSLISTTCELIGQITLPLALICIGASLVFKAFSMRLKPLLFVVMGKAFVYPLVAVTLAWCLGVTGDALTVIVIMSMAPTATASFPAAQQLGGDSALAADAVAVTTTLSLPLYLIVIWLW
jgi:predicted permease